MENGQMGVGSSMMAFVGGAALGVAAGILFAPSSGKETRHRLRKYARRTKDRLEEAADAALEKGRAYAERGREFVEEKIESAGEALKTGRDAAHRERQRLTGRH